MTCKEEFRSGRHVVYNLAAHLVFVTKYRRGVITERVRANLALSFTSVMLDFGGQLLECDGEDDHMHLLVSYPPKHSIAVLVNSLKGVSSRLLRTQNYPEVRGKLYGDHLWSPSYFASSTGGASLDTVRKYIEGQRKGEISSPP